MLTETKPGTSRFDWPALSILSYVLSAFFIAVGFYKMWVYENGESYPYDSINAYVGGDAYNYIINAGYAGAYFTLALVFVLIGSTVAVVKAINGSATTIDAISPIKSETDDSQQFRDLPDL